MDRKITFIGRNINWLIFKGKLEYYTINSGRIAQGFKIEQLLENEQLLKKVIEEGFDSYEKNFEGKEKIVWEDGTVSFKRVDKKFYIPISKKFYRVLSIKLGKR